MIILRTNSNKEYPIEWVGISDFDGCLRFEVPEAADRMAELFSVFTDPAETEMLTRVFDEDERVFQGYTGFKGLDLKPSGSVVLALMKRVTA